VDRSNLIGVAVFVVIGLGLLGGGGQCASVILHERSERASHERWPHVDGRIAGVTEARDGHGERFYWTTTEWTGPDGHTYETRGSSHLSTRSVGEVVPMRYDPADPSHAERIDAGSEDWMPALILGTMGTVFLGIAFRVTRDTLRRARAAKR
jgi:hypothetical protein